MNAHTNHPHTSEHKVFMENGKKTRHERKNAQREKNTNLYPIPYTTWKKREKKATATIFVACVHFQSYGARPHYHQPSLPPPCPPAGNVQTFRPKPHEIMPLCPAPIKKSITQNLLDIVQHNHPPAAEPPSPVF